MSHGSSLARPTHAEAHEQVPLTGRLRGWADRSRSQFRLRVVGADYEQRIEQVRLRYAGSNSLGLDVGTLAEVSQFFGFLHRMYFRTEVHGIERLPEGKVLVVANHSGQLPLDAVILGCSLFFDAKSPRILRATVDRWAATLPVISSFFSRLGSVMGSPENARSLLDAEEAVLVFPEGVRGISKPFTQRYQLQPFGSGFMRLALATGAPILPVAVVGAEEQYINVGNADWLARLAGAPVCPVIPQMFLPFGQLPLPTKYRLFFGEPMRFDSADATSKERISSNVFLVRQAIQAMLSDGLRKRRGVFF